MTLMRAVVSIWDLWERGLTESQIDRANETLIWFQFIKLMNRMRWGGQRRKEIKSTRWKAIKEMELDWTESRAIHFTLAALNIQHFFELANSFTYTQILDTQDSSVQCSVISRSAFWLCYCFWCRCCCSCCTFQMSNLLAVTLNKSSPFKFNAWPSSDNSLSVYWRRTKKPGFCAFFHFIAQAAASTHTHTYEKKPINMGLCGWTVFVHLRSGEIIPVLTNWLIDNLGQWTC